MLLLNLVISLLPSTVGLPLGCGCECVVANNVYTCDEVGHLDVDSPAFACAVSTNPAPTPGWRAR